MKKNKIFNDVFGHPIRVKVKRWYPTTRLIIHGRKKYSRKIKHKGRQIERWLGE